VERVRSADGTELGYERRGSGPPLVLVGGALGTRAAGDEYAEALSSRRSVITYDRRGRGDSGDTPPYAVEREIEDLAAVIDAAGGRAAVYGHSSGAALALETARALGIGAVPRLALYEPPFIVDDTRPPLPAEAADHLDELVAAGRRGDAVEYFLRSGPLVPTAAIEQARASPTWSEHEAIAHTIAYDLRVMGGTMGGSPEPLERFAVVVAPTLVLTGGASPAWQHAGADAIAATLPHAERRTLAGQAHRADARVLAPVLLAFFDATRPA
jgi:hypothetical protein